MLIDERRMSRGSRSREFPTGGERGRGQTEMGIGDDDQNRDERGPERKSGDRENGGGGGGGDRLKVVVYLSPTNLIFIN